MSEAHICWCCKMQGLDFPCRTDGELDANKLATAYFAYFAAAEEHGFDRFYAEKFEWASTCISDLEENEPDRCLDWILVALDIAAGDAEIGVLAAGPLENLIVDHGQAMIERIEGLAANSTLFRRFLSGIWSQGTSETEVWARVQKAVGSGPYLDDDPRTPQGTARRTR